jgi:Tfp pilus assembly protein PilX
MNTRHRKRRRGAVLVAALFCLAVVLAIAMALVRSALVEHRQTQRRAQQLQSFWLAESAAERAALRLRAEEGYTGETWRPQLLEGDAAAATGVATIRVEPVPEGGRKIVVEARYPESETWGIVSRKELLVSP